MFNALTNNQVAEHYAQTKDQDAREEVLRRYEDLVFSCVKQYRSRFDFEDLLQEGRIAMLQALEAYDPTKYEFSTFAVHYISGKVRHYIRDKGHLVRIPAWVQDHYRRELLSRAAFEAAAGREPSVEELAPLMGLSMEKLKQIHTYSPRIISMWSLNMFTTGVKDAKGDLRTLEHPVNMRANIHGEVSGEQDYDLDEALSVAALSVDELIYEHRMSMVEARQLKEFVDG